MSPHHARNRGHLTPHVLGACRASDLAAHLRILGRARGGGNALVSRLRAAHPAERHLIILVCHANHWAHDAALAAAPSLRARKGTALVREDDACVAQTGGRHCVAAVTTAIFWFPLAGVLRCASEQLTSHAYTVSLQSCSAKSQMGVQRGGRCGGATHLTHLRALCRHVCRLVFESKLKLERPK